MILVENVPEFQAWSLYPWWLDGLRALGHDVVVQPLPSGAGFLQRVPGGWIGAADPRRDGVALGQ